MCRTMFAGKQCRMPEWLTWSRIAAPCIALIAIILLLSGCLGLPTLETTPTTVPTRLLPTATATRTSITVRITGDVYVRDEQGDIIGWLYKDDEVQAFCSGDWCRIFSGSYTGYHFWRGCSSDNPEHRSCQIR
jgi:hypothetical protein